MTKNGVGDFAAFLAALISNTMAIFVFMGIFMVLRKKFPIIYSHNVETHEAPMDYYKPEWTDNYFGWWKAAFSYGIGKDTQLNNGALTLDQSMLLEFCDIGKRTMMFIGVPMMLIMGPLHWAFGGNAAGE